MILCRLIALIACVFLFGCGTPEIPVKERWAESIRNYALIPIYPMREDVFIGDVRIHRANGDAYNLNSRMLAKLKIEDVIEANEKTRPSYPLSGEAPKLEGGSNAWQQPTGSLKGSSDGNRLRLAALPKIDAARVTSADLGGGGLVGIWNFLVGTSAEKSETLLVSLSGVETLEIPDALILGKFGDLLAKIKTQGEPLHNAVCAAAQTFGDPTT